MKVTALVMAGGRGKRMALAEEKPLLKVGGKPVIEYVLAALQNAKSVGSIVVAVSRFTPKTAEHVAGLGFRVLQTPGREYVSDMGFAVKRLRLKTVLAVGADLPLLTAEVVDKVVVEFFRCGKPALAVAVPSATRKRLGLGEGYAFDCEGERVVFAGINVNDGSRIDDAELDQAVYVLDRVEVALNINTVEEMRIAEDLFVRFPRKTG
ncbi:MAG: NTP transferase domain-containing protein [Candidatus Bathyarchaeia archaeon]